MSFVPSAESYMVDTVSYCWPEPQLTVVTVVSGIVTAEPVMRTAGTTPISGIPTLSAPSSGSG